MENLKFMRCEICGNIVVFLKNSGMPLSCCGKKMVEIIPNVTEASQEKHLPVIVRQGNLLKVNVGSIEHPMLENHYIEWILLECENGYKQMHLKPHDKPFTFFELQNEEVPVAVYAYCNVHGLWKTSL